jgi:O-antigen/teichoic acid export membrane protein
MKVINKIIKSSLVVFIGLSIQNGLSFISRILLARNLTTGEYGVFVFALSLASLLTSLSLVGLNTGIARNIPQLESSDIIFSQLFTSYLTPTLVSSMTILVIWIAPDSVINELSGGGDPFIVRIFILAVPAMVLVEINVGVYRGYGNTIYKIFTKDILRPSLETVLFAIIIYTIMDIFFISLAFAFTYFIAGLLGLIFVKKLIPSPVSLSIDTSLIRFSLPLLGTSVIAMLLSNLDTFLLGYFTDSSSIGIYGVAYSLALSVSIITSSINYLAMPSISGSIKDSLQEATRYYHLSTRWSILGTTIPFLIFTFWSVEVISGTFGSGYVLAKKPLVILSVAIFIHSATGPTGGVITAIGHTKSMLIIDSLSLILNLILNILLIPIYGIVGAAVSTTASYFLFNYLYLYIIYRESIDLPFLTKTYPPIFVLIAEAKLLSLYLNGSLTAVFISCVTLTTSLAVLIFIFGFEEEEISIMSSVFNRLV